ncbi:MAG: hypothetical protein ACP5JH_02575 [Bacteroidota bacterium]
MTVRIFLGVIIGTILFTGFAYPLHSLHHTERFFSDRDSVLLHAERVLVAIRESYHRFSILRAVREIALPSFLVDALELQAMIRDERFKTVRALVTDRELVDLLYWQAVIMSDCDIRRGLLLTTLAVMDHWKLGVRAPLVGVFWLPLSLETNEEFRLRVSHLPKRLFSDTPSDSLGDRDKLQHFFGSAYLTYGPGGREFADIAGEFVEWGESIFVVGGVNDPRDVAANRRGQAFAKRLLEDPEARPSSFLEGKLKEHLSH